MRARGAQNSGRFVTILVIAASIIVALRLARDDISTPSPRVLSTVSDSVGLARMMLKRVLGGGTND
jgi:hypothetical protein